MDKALFMLSLDLVGLFLLGAGWLRVFDDPNLIVFLEGLGTGMLLVGIPTFLFFRSKL